jgi:hypothetical protein
MGSEKLKPVPKIAMPFGTVTAKVELGASGALTTTGPLGATGAAGSTGISPKAGIRLTMLCLCLLAVWVQQKWPGYPRCWNFKKHSLD